MVLKRTVNATQIKRYREPLNVGRIGKTQCDSAYNLRARECTTQSKETPISTRSDDCAKLKNTRQHDHNLNEQPSQREATEKPTENQANIIMRDVCEPQTIHFHHVNTDW